MISVLLTILKIIGIVLLCILGILILVVLAVLLIPLRYQAEGSCRSKELNASGRVTWLLHLISVRGGYRAKDGPFFSVQILGIPLMDSRRKKKSAGTPPPTSENPTGKRRKPSENAAGESPVPEISPEILESLPPKTDGTVEKNGRSAEKNARAVSASKAEKLPSASSKAPIKAKETKEQKKARKAAAKERKAAEKSRKKAEKEQKNAEKAAKKEASAQKRAAWKEKAEDVLDMLQDKENQRSLSMLKRQIGKLLHHVLPQRLHLQARIGFSDPALTGQILGIIYAFYPLYGDHIRVIGEFEEEVLEGEFFLKGRIRIGTLIIIAARVILDKNIRKMLKTVGGKKNGR